MKKRDEQQIRDEKNRKAYAKPHLERVDLALAETLSAGCKLADVCDDPVTGTSEAGS